MTRSKSLFARHDTFFGVCEAIGQDFRFNPNWLRLAVAAALLAAPVATLVTYFSVGLVVLASRLIFPAGQAAAPVEAAPALKSDNDAEQIDLAQAA